jgi:hypothetical protein
LVEQKTFNLLVDGSNPSRPTIQSAIIFSPPRFAKNPFNNQRVGALVLVKEKQLAPHSAILRAHFSGVVICRPKDAFRLVFSFQAQNFKSAATRQHQRIFF